MTTTAIIQARMGSSRLPGKVALPLNDRPVLGHIIRRVEAATAVDDIVVATSFWTRDDIVVDIARKHDATVYRGSEDDVLGRILHAADEQPSEHIVRVTGDNPFVDPELIDHCVRVVAEDGIDYASNKIERTFPLGVDAEAFTKESLATVEKEGNSPKYREHVTPFYYERRDRFSLENILVSSVYASRERFPAGPELRMTLDEPADYDVYNRVYSELDFDDVLDARQAARYILKHGLDEINQDVTQDFQ